jgi:hypothetical protein
VTVDAAAYRDRGPLRICISTQLDELPECVEFGTGLSIQFDGEYPRTVNYEVYLAPKPEAEGMLIREGSLSLTCEESAIAVSFATP